MSHSTSMPSWAKKPSCSATKSLSPMPLGATRTFLNASAMRNPPGGGCTIAGTKCGGIPGAVLRSRHAMPRTLVVQQDRALRETIAAALSRAGHQTLFAETAGEAESALAGGTAEALIVDRALPGESIVALLRRLRAHAGTRR